MENNKLEVIGNCLLAAAFLAYTGPFTPEFREKMIYEDWMPDIRANEIPISDISDIKIILSDTADVIQYASLLFSNSFKQNLFNTLNFRWESEGIASDNYFLQNAILILRACRRALCIDPEELALNWIKHRESKNNVKILTFEQNDFVQQLEQALTLGTPVVVEDIGEYIDPIVIDLFIFQPKCRLTQFPTKEFIAMNKEPISFYRSSRYI